MDEIEQIESWLRRRDELELAARHASPAERRGIRREVRRVMRQVIALMAQIKWESVRPAA